MLKIIKKKKQNYIFKNCKDNFSISDFSWNLQNLYFSVFESEMRFDVYLAMMSQWKYNLLLYIIFQLGRTHCKMMTTW